MKWLEEEEKFILDLIKKGKNPLEHIKEFNDKFGTRTYEAISRKIRREGWKLKQWKESRSENEWTIETNDSRIRTVEDALKYAEIDTDIWEIMEVKVGAWDVTMKIKKLDQYFPHTTQNHLIRIKLRRKVPKKVEDSINDLIKKLESHSPITPPIKRITSKLDNKHAMEVCLFDPHYGLQYENGWSLKMCEEIMWSVLEEIIELSEHYAPFDEIVLPLGNDFFHVDNIQGTTFKGTPQPEAVGYHQMFIGGEAMAIKIIDRLKELANVKVYMIPGNHDFTTSFVLGRVLSAYYRNDQNVTVYADSSPYKFHEYGVNLIGYEHGHGIKPIRLASLMANECPDAWARTKNGWREWHLGDQHRKGSMSPIVMEEQGVSVEFLPGITLPNEWHNRKSFNWQKRAAMAFIWHKEAGLRTRIQVNIDRYLNKVLGK